MTTHLFQSFAEMLNGLPAAVIRKAMDLENRMLEKDLLYKRVPETDEVISILSFCQFIKAAAAGDNISSAESSPDHVAIYRKVVKRLIEAGELPTDAAGQFDFTFSSRSLNALAS
jgi:hypothetical protein